jgi:hypothetical protein
MYDMFAHRLLQRFAIATVVIALLFAVVRANPTESLSFSLALLFWLAHIGLGLGCCIVVASAANRARTLRPLPAWARLLAVGVVASLLFAPLAMGLERWVPTVADDDTGILVRWEVAGGALGVLAEWVHVAPPFLLTWMLLNWRPAGGNAAMAGARTAPMVAAETPPQANAPVAPPSDPAHPSAPDITSNNLVDALPPAIGRDVIYVTSDLHYLHVHTTSGKATVLGGLAVWEREAGPAGIRIHRSHWVARRHVRRVARSAAGWYCELSPGMKLPISRRRLAAVREELGSGFAMLPPDKADATDARRIDARPHA